MPNSLEGRGREKKRMPFCNGKDRGSKFAPERKQQQTSPQSYTEQEIIKGANQMKSEIPSKQFKIQNYQFKIKDN
jgi:hypothetical protein